MQIYSFSCKKKKKKKRLCYLKLDFLYFRHKVPWNKCTSVTEGSRIWLTLLLRSLWNTVHIKKKNNNKIKIKKQKTKQKSKKKKPQTTLLCFRKKCDSTVSVLDFCLFCDDSVFSTIGRWIRMRTSLLSKLTTMIGCHTCRMLNFNVWKENVSPKCMSFILDIRKIFSIQFEYKEYVILSSR